MDRRRRPGWSVVALAGLVGACTQAPPEVQATADVPIKADAPAVAVTPAVGPTRAFVYLTSAASSATAEVWLPGPPPRSLDLRTEFGGDARGRGSITPRLSPDGTWLAYISDGAVRLRRVDGAQERLVVQHPADRVELRLSGWAPDVQALLFHVDGFEDDREALPRGLAAGFYLARLEGPAPTRLAGPTELVAWSRDSSAVLHQEPRPAGNTALIRLALAGAQPELLHTITGEDGFAQAVVHGDEIVYLHDRTIVRSKLDGSGVVRLTDRGGSYQYQKPHIAPDGSRVAYLDGRTLKVLARDTGVASTLDECEVLRCTFVWESDAALLLVDAGELRRVDLAGKRTRIASNVVGVVVAGE